MRHGSRFMASTTVLSALLSLLIQAACLAMPWETRAEASEAFWTLLRQPGHAVLIRHADAPGSGDPPGFRLDDCRTQRNLGPEGRAQARRVGEAFRARGITVARVLSSQWCRCRETAELMALGPPVEAFPALNSLFHDRSRAGEQMRDIRALLAGLKSDQLIVLATHHATILELTGIAVGSGEMVAVRIEAGGAPKVAGRLRVH